MLLLHEAHAQLAARQLLQCRRGAHTPAFCLARLVQQLGQPLWALAPCLHLAL